MTSTRRLTGLLLLLLGLTSGSVAAQEINFSTANFTITEGQPIDFDLTLSAPAPAAGLTPFGDISTSGGNFGINAGTDQVFANFAPGSEAVSATFVTSNDDVDEPDGTVTFTLIGGVPDAGITIGSANTITVTILDDDTAGLSFSTASLTVAEAGSQTYTVVLDSEPTASVTVTPTSGNAAAATVSPATLTFTTSNWDTAQSVTVSGVNDGDQDDESVTISHTASGGGYDDVSGTLTVTIQDDDSPGLSFAAVPTSVTEGSSATYTVQLATRPSSSVIVMPESSNPAAATVSSGLFFTASNWDTAQTLTISGVGDTNIMNETLVISHTATSNNADYNNLTDSITITTIDDDSAISPDAPAAIATFVSEAFGSGVVRVDISWPEPADNGCTIDEYAYTSVGTDPQGIEEGTTSALSYREFYLRSDLPYTVMVHTVSSAVGCTNSAATTLVYSGVAPAAPTGFTGTAGDTQVALFWINPNDPSITRWEYELIADGSGSGIWIEIPGSDANTNSYTVTGLTNGIFHVFRVRAVNPEGISLSSPVVRRIPQVLGSQPRLNFSSTVFSVAQDGTAEYTVQLNTEPSANVTVALESGDTATATVSPTTLTFTTSNRELAQTVTVSGVATGSTNITHTATSDDDDYDNLVRSVQVTTTAAAPNNAPTVDTEIANQTLSVGSTSTVDISATFADSDDDTLTYSVMSDDTAVATVSVTDEIVTVTGEAVGSANISVIADDGNGATVTDTFSVTVNAAPGITFSSSALTVDEGDTTTYTVVLDTAPTDDVTVTPTSGNTDAASVSGALTFTDSNWNTVQTVTVTGVDDDNDDFESDITISHAATSDDSNYTISDAGDVSVTTNDDDVTISVSGPDTIVEGSTATITYTLSAPLAEALGVTDLFNFTDTISAGQTAFSYTVGPFTDDADTVDESFTVRIASIDNPLVTIAIASHTFTIIDDDRDAGVILSATSGSAAEDGGEIEYTVLLDAPPTGSVTITPTSGDDTTADVSGALTFTTSNWFTPQTITVTGVNDDLVNASDRTATISHAASGGGYGSVTVGDFTFTANDDDIPVPGVTLSPTSGAAAEDGGTATYTVVLDTQPSADVTVTPTSGATDVADVSAALTFTTSNFGTAQTITVTGVDDAIVNASNRTATISHAASGGGYASVTVGDYTFTANDDDDPRPPDAPVLPLFVNFLIADPISPIVLIRWSAPPSDNGCPISRYEVTVSTGGSVVETARSDYSEGMGGSATLSFINANNPYTVEVEAVSTVCGNRSAPATLIYADPPAAPTGLSATPDDGEVTLNWDELGDASVIIWQFSQDNGASWQGIADSDATTTSHTVTGLANSTTYSFRVRTLNITRTAGGASAAVTATPQGPPGLRFSTTSVSVAEAGTATYTVVLTSEPTASVTVTPESGNTDAATVSPATLTFSTTDWNTAQSVTVTGVDDTNTASETVTISHNASGGGYDDVSGTVTVTTSDDDILPAQPTGLGGTAATPGVGAVTLNWDNPNNASITRWEYEQIANGSGSDTWIEILGSDADTTRFTVTGLSIGTAHSFRIRAVNNTGNSPASASATATPLAQTLTLSAAQATITEGGDASLNANIAVPIGGLILLDYSVTGAERFIASNQLNQSFFITPSQTQSHSSLTISTIDDNIDEADASVTVTITGTRDFSDNPVAGVPIGSTATFTILDNDTAPVVVNAIADQSVEQGADVSIDISDTFADQDTLSYAATSGDESIATATVSGTTLTVTGVAVGSTDITLSATDPDDASNNGAETVSDTFSVNVTADLPGVTLSATSGSAGEDGGTATYTVVLNTQPSGSVTVTPTSGDDTTADVSAALTFTTSNFGTAQTITVTGVDDAIVNASNRTATISHAASGGGYASVTVGDYTFTANDDDAPGLSFSPASLTVAEAGSETYTVRLNTAPTDDVTVTPESGNTDAATVSSALTFTDSNWFTPQTITVTGVDDTNDDFETLNITHAATSDDSNYTISDAGDVSVTTSDNDLTLSIVALNSTITEGEAAEFVITLSSSPAVTVSVRACTSQSGNFVNSFADCTDSVFFAKTILVSTNFSISTIDDIVDEADGSVTRTIEISNADLFPPPPGLTITQASATVIVIDDDGAAGATLSSASGSAAEDGGAIEYTVRLDAPPTGSVTITPTSGATDVATVSGALTFSDSNWFTLQTVTVTGVDDDIDNDPDRTATISHAASGGGYASVTVGDYTFTATDDDAVGVTLSATALTVDENDTTTYSVVLDTAPTDDVTVTPESGNTDAATVSSALTFTDSNWDTVQTITVTGVDDTNDDFETLNITHAATSDDSNYTISDAGDVSVTTNDDDVTISISGPDTVVEGSSKRFTHTLSAPLAEALMVVADVGIFTRTIPAGQTTSGRSLTSTDGNDDDELFTVTILSTDNPLVTIAIASHTVTIIDDDRDADVSLSATSGSAAEDGGEIEYTVLLDAPPTGSVTITPTSGDDTTADVSGALTFTTSNWFTPQTVTVTGVNDDIDNNPDRTATISHTVASSDSDYDAISVSDFDFTATDDDIPVPGVTFSSSALTVDEGDTTTYTVVLDTAPTDDVTVTPESGNTDAATVSGALTFTTSNFGTAQTVTVTGVDDTNDDFETLNITHAATSDDSNYTISDAGDVSVTTNDDDVTVSISGPDTVVEGSSITFTYTLSAPLAEALVVTEALFGFTDTILAGQTTVSYTVTYRADPNTVDGFDTQTIRGTDNPLVTIAIASITVTIIDPDRDAGITLSATSGSAAEDGGEIEYTVLLDAPPTGSVTITPTSGDDTAADVSGALTFTTSNWFTPQTITVTGVNDAIVNASNRTATISHAASGGGYGSVTVGDFTFTATDDEIPVPGVTLSATSGNAGEDGGTATYTVVLDTQPSADVTVTPTSGDNTTADVSAALTFTTSNFGTAQTITVTGVNDDLVNASDRTATISHTISGGGYGSVTVGTFTFTATDDDIPGLSFSTASLTVAEAGSETYTVRLNTAPTADVTVTPTSGNTDAATVSGALTFTDSNWATVQSVTVTGVDDDNGTDETFNIIHLLSSTDTDYSTVTGSVGVTTTDDDTAAVTLSPTGGSATEDGDTAIYNVVLDTQPSGNVTVTPTSGNADAATVSGALTFTMTNWDTAQTVTVTGVDDDIDNASNRTATISHAATSSDGDYSGITIETYMFTATDDDTAAVTLSATSGNASEDGGTATYTVVLDTQPTGSVTITPTSGDDTTADVSAALTFTTSNFGTAQTVTVTGVDDAIQNSSNRTATISHTASGGDYNSVTVGTFTFTATDDDTAGLRFTPDSLTVAEAGTATYTVRLNTAPTDDVTVTPTSGDPDAATVSGALTFTDSNWATAQTITVTGVDDANSASETFDISHTATGGGYDAVTGTVGVTTTDDDAPGLSFTPDSVSVAEAGSETYTVVLDTAPTDDVTVTPTSGNTDAATVSSALTFTTSNFGTAQTITVTGVDDDNGTDETFNITHAASGGGYGSVTGSVAVTTTDDDTPGLSFTPDSVSVGEAGSETYTVVLDTQPSGEVILFPTSSNAGAATVRPTMLTFTTSNWDTVQTITVTGVDDGNATDETFNIMHRAIGGGYDSVNATVAVTTDDDDTAGVTVTPPMFTVAEAGSTTYTVVLDSQPTASVTITPASGDTGVVTVSDALIFTTANWDTAQPVTVSGEDDADTLDETVTISHSASSSDSDYSGLTVDTVSVTTDDDDSPNNAPTVASEIANQNVTVDNRITVNVSTTFTDSDNDALSYSVMSDDDTTASVSVSGNVVSVTGVAAGSADISVTADDGNGGSISDTFMVSVTAAATNNAPTVVTEIANQNVTVGNRITVNVSSTFTDSDNDALSYSVMSDDTAVATVSVIGNTVTVTGVAAGSADISVTASDPDGESVTDIFSVSVAAAATNNAPTVVTAIADQTVTVNAMTSMDVSTTFTDSDNDALTYSASSNNTNIATVTVSGNTVTVTGVAAGSTTISVTASDPDGESVTDIFSVSVSVTAAATNNAPTVATEIADQTVTVNAMTSMDVSSTFTDSDNDTLTYSAMSDDTNIATVTVSGSVVSVSGVAAGSTTISVTASDPDGESVTDIFSVSVTAAATNNAPTVVTEIADQTVTVNAMTSMDVSTTFTDSDNDTLSYSASSNDTNIATVTVSGSVVSVSGVAAGSTTISVTANDGNGGMVSDIFAVTVDTMPTNNAPTVVNRITDQMVTAGNRISVDVSSIFADSDNDTLSYSASSNNTNIATVTVSGSVVSVTGIAAGSTTISVTANDGNGGMVSDIFAVTTTGDAAIMSIGELNETVLPEVTLAIVRHTQGVVARRVGQIASGAGAAAKVLTIAGQSSLGAALSTHADAINAGVLSLKDVLGNSDFVLPLNASSSGGPAARTSVSLWGGGEYRSLSDDDSVFDWDGDLFSASLGIDANLRNNILLGVAGSWSDADVDYRQENQSNEGDYTLSLFSVHPYAGWTGKRLSWWLTGGYGYGELSVGDDVNENSSDVSLLSFGTGASGVLWTGDISTLRLKGDFLWAEMDVEGGDGISPYTTDVNGSRLLLEASQVHSLNGGISLEPSLELGVRYDGGDGDDRTNMELGAGLRLRGNRLTLDGSVYALLGGDDFEDWNIREWGVRGLLHLQGGRYGRGLSFSLTPGYGTPERDAEALLWNDGHTNNLVNTQADQDGYGMRWDTELGYGILAGQGMLTPYGQMTLSDGSKRYRLGLRWSQTELFELELEGERRQRDSQGHGQGHGDDVDNAILLQGRLRF